MENLGVRIQDRDVSIMIYASEMQFASYETINNLYFKGCKDLSKLKNRINKLKEAGLVKVVYRVDNAKALISITNKGAKILEALVPGKEVLGMPKNIRIDELLHTVFISEIRARIENAYALLKWHSERYILHSNKDKNIRSYTPDGIFETDKGLYVFEFERTQKSTGRIDKRLSEVRSLISNIVLKRKDKETFGLIICETESIKQKYLQVKRYDHIRVYLRSELMNMELSL